MLGAPEFREIEEAKEKAAALQDEDRDACEGCLAKKRELQNTMGLMLCWMCRLQLRLPPFFAGFIAFFNDDGRCR